MPHGNPRLTQLFRQALERCSVTADESVLVLTQAESRAAYVDAVLGAVGSLGGSAEVLQLPGIKSDVFDYGGRPDHMLELDRYAADRSGLLEFVVGTDVVVDLTADRLVHTRFRWAVTDSDARMLSVHEPPEVLERLVPTDDLSERLAAARELLESADEMRVTSEAGTDLAVSLTDETLVVTAHGYTRGAGDWDGYPGGFVACYTTDRSHEGRLVLDAGDVVLPMGRYVERPVAFRVEAGRLTAIEGEGADAALLRDYYEQWGEAARRMSHVGFGLDDRAEWDALAFSREPLTGMDNRAFAGSFMWSSGPNQPIMDRDTRAHFDFPMRDCTVAVDGEVVIEAGELVAPSLAP